MPKSPPVHKVRVANPPRRWERANTPEQREADRLRGTARWKRLRKQVRTEQPLCIDPLGNHEREGRIEPMHSVHHIKPLQKHLHLCFDRDNVVGLCRECHDRIDAMERRGQDTAGLFAHTPGGVRIPVAPGASCGPLTVSMSWHNQQGGFTQ